MNTFMKNSSLTAAGYERPYKVHSGNINIVPIRYFFLLIIIVVSGIPITVFGDFPLSVVDIAIVGVSSVYILLSRDLQFPVNLKYLVLSGTISLLAILVVAIIGEKGSPTHMLLSWANFFKIYWAYLAGYLMVNNFNELRRYCSSTFYILSSVYALCIIYDHNIFNVHGVHLLGVSIYGTKGINAGFVYLASSLMLHLSFVGDYVKKWQLKLISWILILGTIGMIVYSSSRQAILGLLIFLYFFCTAKILRGIVFLSILATIAVSIDMPDYFIAKMDVKTEALRDANYDSFTAGRLQIYKEMLNGIVENPIVGSLFSGFSESMYAEKIYGRSSGLSPHNQYLGSLWKMGIVAGIPYLIFLAKVFADFWNFKRVFSNNTAPKLLFGLCIVVYLIFMNTQDFLLFSLTGNMFMFLSGGIARILRDTNRENSLAKRYVEVVA